MCDTVCVGFKTLGQRGQALHKCACSTLKLSGTFICLCNTICVLLDAVRELSCSIGELTAAICRLVNTIGKFACAVRKVASILLELRDLIIHIFQNALVFLFNLLVIIKEA